ncbi:PhnD/SsuA/transferrin family substrate-binding protein [Candidatus Albibeggiatoa sp. nov. BB20]|uniref:phosphate/phosphite/phosphonate ABC transporter substrate-binding protein n=1 Tax=Candidatus Albibeggiatoa sp. nov. BB20 TaxID=3162723 RepID=UPI0033652F50
MKNLVISLMMCGLLLYTLPTLSFAAESGSQTLEKPLIVGIFPRRSAKITMKLFRPLSDYLSEKLGREVKVVTSKNFKTFWKGVLKHQYDLVHYNQYHYVVSHQKYGYQVILKNEEMGNDTITGSIIVRKDSGIKSVLDLKGKKIVFGGGKRAMQSYIVARYLLEQGGLKWGEYEADFAKNPPSAIKAAFFKQADAAGAGDVVLKLNVVKKKVDIEQLEYLARGERLPHLPWAVKSDMPTELRDEIQMLMADLKQSSEGQTLLKNMRLTSLNPATDEEFNRHREIIQAVLDEQY